MKLKAVTVSPKKKKKRNLILNFKIRDCAITIGGCCKISSMWQKSRLGIVTDKFKKTGPLHKEGTSSTRIARGRINWLEPLSHEVQSASKRSLRGDWWMEESLQGGPLRLIPVSGRGNILELNTGVGMGTSNPLSKSRVTLKNIIPKTFTHFNKPRKLCTW